VDEVIHSLAAAAAAADTLLMMYSSATHGAILPSPSNNDHNHCAAL